MMQKLMEINDHLVRTLAECEQLRSDQKTLQEICSIRLQRINELQAELRKACAERDEAVEHAGRLQAERDELRRDQTKIQRICADGGRRITELKAELDATRKQLQNVLFEQEEADDAPTEPKKPKKPVKTPAGQSDLVRDVSHYTEAAEVDTAADTPATEYTPPEGWRVLAVGEVLRDGDVWVNHKGEFIWPTLRVGGTVNDERYIRRIGPESEPQPEPQPEPEYKPYTFAAYIVGDRVQPDALRIVWATEEWIEQSKFDIVHRMRDMHLFDNDGGCNITEYHETLTLTLKVQ